jgi:hypothetical protein
MPTTKDVWPVEDTTYPDYFGTTITAAGARVAMVEDLEIEYYERALRAGYLLDWDPAGVNNPEDRSDGEPPPVEGSTDQTVDEYTVITVDIGLGVEVAFADLEFKPPYATSSTIDLGTGEYSLVRDGGWPVGAADPPVIVIVDPPPAPTPGPAEWAEIYSVDFTALPTQSIAAAGAYTIDGLTWYAKGSLTGLPFGVTMTCALVNGSGLGLACSGGIGLNSALTYAGRWFGIPLSAFPDLATNAPFIVRARFTSTDFANATGWIGLVDSTNDGAALLTAQRSRDRLAGNWRTGGTNTDLYTKISTGVEANLGVSLPLATAANSIYGVYAVTPAQPIPIKQAAAGAGIPADPSTVVFPGSAATFGSPATYANPMIAFMISTNGPNTVFMTHLSIHQPASTFV